MINNNKIVQIWKVLLDRIFQKVKKYLTANRELHYFQGDMLTHIDMIEYIDEEK